MTTHVTGARMITLFVLFGYSSGSFRKAILDKHNLHRGNAGLPLLTWNFALATAAQAHTDILTQSGCHLKHSTGDFRSLGQGENLWMTSQKGLTAYKLGFSAAKGWYGEIDRYKYPKNPTDSWSSCVDWKKVGHFTQMMWSTTTKIGCGRGTCSNGKTIVTCHYLAHGNINGQPLFGIDNYKQLIASGEKLARCG
ncbi:uncharacterized protein LOC134844492 [Symsagittifera roscoffensis]|uniref:uncharacterized protein LOC134844492 n=1 Tax=Symsagittifera roscoffensis TaxID=84072 RepID=UPI00307BE747